MAPRATLAQDHSAQRGGLDAAVQVPENVAAEYTTPAPAVYAAPVYVSTTATPAPVAADNAPAPAVCTTSAPALHAAPAPVIEYETFASVNEYVASKLCRFTRCRTHCCRSSRHHWRLPYSVRPMKLAETTKVVEIGPPRSAVSIPPMRVAPDAGGAVVLHQHAT